VNLARLMLRTTGREAALSVLNAADHNAVRDQRLSALRAALQPSDGSAVPGKTRRSTTDR
jgi:hypothetical protein